MRVGRPPGLFIALFLLALAATAYAECAWVLWGNSFISVKGFKTTADDDWSLMDTTETRAQCMARLDERVTRGAATFRISERGESFRVLVPIERKEGVQNFIRLECLPDTVDPRGPKGK